MLSSLGMSKGIFCKNRSLSRRYVKRGLGSYIRHKSRGLYVQKRISEEYKYKSNTFVFHRFYDIISTPLTSVKYQSANRRNWDGINIREK